MANASTAVLDTPLSPAALGGNPSGAVQPANRVRYFIQASSGLGVSGSQVTIGNSGKASPDLSTDTIATSPIGVALRQTLLASDLDMQSWLKNHPAIEVNLFVLKAYAAVTGTEYMLWTVNMAPDSTGNGLPSFQVTPPTQGGVAELEISVLYSPID